MAKALSKHQSSAGLYQVKSASTRGILARMNGKVFPGHLNGRGLIFSRAEVFRVIQDLDPSFVPPKNVSGVIVLQPDQVDYHGKL